MEEYELMEAVFDKVKEIVAKDVTVAAGMKEIITFCKKNYEHADWMKFNGLEYDETSEINNWIENVLKNDPIPPKINGLWFGLYNPCNDDGEASADIYIAGNDGFDKDDEDGEWAVDPKYFPETRYLKSKILDKIYQIAYSYEDGLENTAEYALCFAYGCLITKYLLVKYSKSIISSKTKSIGVAVGFDSGDFLVIGELNKDGFTISTE
jgi:hypothetical protein